MKPGIGTSLEEAAVWADIEDAFGIELADYGHVCAICGQSETRPRSLSVDHDHATGAIRGLLCDSCNVGIARLGEDPGRLHAAAEYLQRYERRDWNFTGGGQKA